MVAVTITDLPHHHLLLYSIYTRLGSPAVPGELPGGLQSKAESCPCLHPWVHLPQISWDCWVSHPAGGVCRYNSEKELELEVEVQYVVQ